LLRRSHVARAVGSGRVWPGPLAYFRGRVWPGPLACFREWLAPHRTLTSFIVAVVTSIEMCRVCGALRSSSLQQANAPGALIGSSLVGRLKPAILGAVASALRHIAHQCSASVYPRRHGIPDAEVIDSLHTSAELWIVTPRASCSSTLRSFSLEGAPIQSSARACWRSMISASGMTRRRGPRAVRRARDGMTESVLTFIRVACLTLRTKRVPYSSAGAGGLRRRTRAQPPPDPAQRCYSRPRANGARGNGA